MKNKSRKILFSAYVSIPLFLFLTLIGTFIITKGTTPHASELSFIESSILGPSAGSVIPASCESSNPFRAYYYVNGYTGVAVPESQMDQDSYYRLVWGATSHFNGDCTTQCPASALTYDPYFDPTATACTPAVPSINSITINAAKINPNNSNQYVITVVGSDPLGGANITHEYALINYQGANAGAYRGYLTFYYDGSYTGWDSLKDKRSCSGGGIAALQAGYGEGFINLDSCSTSVNGVTRTTTYTVRFDKSFRSPYTENDISGYIISRGIEPGWQNFDVNFGLNIPTAINNVRISSPVVVANGLNQYTITVDASSPVGDTGNNTVGHQYSIINYNAGTNDSGYRGYVGWSFDNTFPYWGGSYKSAPIACSGGGFGALQGGYPGANSQNGYGNEYMNLVSCSTSENSTGPGNGNDSRSTSFVVTFDPSFTTPLSNALWGWAQNGYGEYSSWVSFSPFSIVSGALNVNSCLIPADSGSCTQPLGWSTTNAQGLSEVTSNTPAPGTVIYSSNSGWLPNNTVSGPPGTKQYFLYNSSQQLDTKITTISCTPGTSWVATSSKCVGTAAVLPMSGSITVTSCTILSGGSSCFQPLGWSTTNPQATSKVTSDTPVASTTIYNSNSGWLPANTVTGIGTKQYYLYNNGVLLDTKSANSVCVSGTSWDGSKCTGPMSGNLSVSANNCIIAAGNSTCSVLFTWGTVNPRGISAVTRSNPNPGLAIFTGNNGGPSFSTVSGAYPSITYYLYNDSIELASTTVIATCVAGTTWNLTAGKCIGTNATSMTGNLIVSADTCTIPNGASSCNVDLTWFTASPVSTSQITRNRPTPNEVLYTANDGGPSPAAVSGNFGWIGFYLYNDGQLLDSKSVVASCGVGGWNTTSDKCVNPRVIDARIDPYITSNPTIYLSCSDSNNYSIEVDTTSSGNYLPFDSGPYSGPVTSTALTSGTYKFVCKNGNIDSPPTLVAHNNSPLPPTTNPKIRINTNNVNPDDPVTVTWEVTNPNPACRLSAAVVCTNGACTTDQTAYQSTLNTLLTTGSTDTNDPNGSRTITVAASTIPQAELIARTFRALGQKTFRVKYTTDITYSCGPGLQVTRRILVTRSIEQ